MKSTPEGGLKEPETRRLQTFAARKERSLHKEPVVTQQYDGGGPGLQVPSRNTGRGVHSCGKLKGRQACKRRETNKRTASHVLVRRGV